MALAVGAGTAIGGRVVIDTEDPTAFGYAPVPAPIHLDSSAGRGGPNSAASSAAASAAAAVHVVPLGPLDVLLERSPQLRPRSRRASVVDDAAAAAADAAASALESPPPLPLPLPSALAKELSLSDRFANGSLDRLAVVPMNAVSVRPATQVDAVTQRVTLDADVNDMGIDLTALLAVFTSEGQWTSLNSYAQQERAKQGLADWAAGAGVVAAGQRGAARAAAAVPFGAAVAPRTGAAAVASSPDKSAGAAVASGPQATVAASGAVKIALEDDAHDGF
jgi:hypothetical protein